MARLSRDRRETARKAPWTTTPLVAAPATLRLRRYLSLHYRCLHLRTPHLVILHHLVLPGRLMATTVLAIQPETLLAIPMTTHHYLRMTPRVVVTLRPPTRTISQTGGCYSSSSRRRLPTSLPSRTLPMPHVLRPSHSDVPNSASPTSSTDPTP